MCLQARKYGSERLSTSSGENLQCQDIYSFAGWVSEASWPSWVKLLHSCSEHCSSQQKLQEIRGNVAESRKDNWDAWLVLSLSYATQWSNSAKH